MLAEHGDVDGAVETARPALDAARTLKSKRLNQRLVEFTTQLAPYDNVPAVADYRAQTRRAVTPT